MTSDAARLTAQEHPLARYLALDDFLAENRNLTSVVVPSETLIEYLKDAEIPDHLVAAVEDSASGC